MKVFFLLVSFLLPVVFLSAQRQLDIQGNPSSMDTVATIKVNFSGLADVVGLAVHAQSRADLGIGASMFGGSIGLRGNSIHGYGLFGHSQNDYGIKGSSDQSDGIYGYSDTDYGVRGHGYSGGLIGESSHGVGVYGRSTSSGGAGVFGSSNIVGVHGYSHQYPVGYIFDYRIGVLGTSDSLGILGIAQFENGHGVLGVTHANHSRSVKGEATGTNSIGVMGVAPGANSTGVWGNGVTGAYFVGSGGTAIQLGGASTNYSTAGGNDDGVIRTQKDQIHGDFILVTNDEMAIRLDDDDNSTAHFKVFNGDSAQIFSLDEGGNLTITGTYNPSSDREMKEDLTAIDPASILARLSTLPLSEWQFKGESVRHIGPMAQDFYTAFRLGQGNTTIATVDADGVLMAAIQALKQENDELRSTIDQFKSRLDELERKIE